ncbi:MAG: hypothetical protein Ta2E_09420 [Mycoplasmoidaceae bacterium]|nr:MAG: hypothetical protein Ta2E_09420 [Mycoplasmoidaceae bacterium]
MENFGKKEREMFRKEEVLKTKGHFEEESDLPDWLRYRPTFLEKFKYTSVPVIMRKIEK